MGERATTPLRTSGEEDYVLFLIFSCCNFAILAAGLFAAMAYLQTELTLGFVMLFGAIGCFTNAANNFLNRNLLPSYLKSHGGLQLYMLCASHHCLGAIIALISYLFFASDLVSGPLVPKFVCRPEDSCRGLLEMIHHWRPEDPEEYMKAFAWGFIAGFAEGYIFNILGQVGIPKNSQ